MKKFMLDETDVLRLGKFIYYRLVALTSFSDVVAGNKGGYLASELCLSHEGDCWVYDKAVVGERCRITGNATVSGKSELRGVCQLSGNAAVGEQVKLLGQFKVSGNASLRGDMYVLGKGEISGNARLTGKVYINGDVVISGNAEVKDKAALIGECHLYSQAIVGCTLTDQRVGHNALLLSVEDFVHYKKIGLNGYSLFAFKQQGQQEVMVYHGPDIRLPLSEFEEIVTAYYQRVKIPNAQRILQDYENCIDGIKAHLLEPTGEGYANPT